MSDPSERYDRRLYLGVWHIPEPEDETPQRPTPEPRTLTDAEIIERTLQRRGTLQIPIDLALEAAARQPEDIDHSAVELAERMLADTTGCPPPIIEYFLPDTWADNDAR